MRALTISALISASIMILACAEEVQKKPKQITTKCEAALEGATRCIGSTLEVCEQQFWVTIRDCADSDLLCSMVDAGTMVADCVPEPSGCDGFTADAGMVNYDPEIFSFSEATLVDSSGQRLLIVQNWPSDGGVTPGTTASREISEGNDTYSECGVCAFVVDNSQIPPRAFFAKSGSVTLTAPAATGDEMQFVFSNLKFVEVDPESGFDSVPLPNGGCFDIAERTFAGPSEHWPCAVIESEELVALSTGGSYCDSVPGQGQYDLLACQGECDETGAGCEVHKVADCDEASLQCNEASNVDFTATCE